MPEFITRVYGIPTPAGSKTPLPTKAGVRLVDGGSTTARQARAVWRQDVIACAITDMEEQGWEAPDRKTQLALEMFFYMPKPKNAAKRLTRSVARPDGGKLQRATEDALTIAGVWHDDSQVVDWSGTKWYATEDEPPGCFIRVWTIE